jgi:Transcriptional Coactivator p15 (PC4)
MNLAEPIEIGKFFKNRKGDIVVVQIKEFEGVIFADARQFYTGADGISRPTKKGLAITLRRLPELVEPLDKALTRASELGLIRMISLPRFVLRPRLPSSRMGARRLAFAPIIPHVSTSASLLSSRG